MSDRQLRPIGECSSDHRDWRSLCRCPLLASRRILGPFDVLRPVKMRIHILSSHATGGGGADVYTSGLVKRMAARGLDIHLFCFSATDDVQRYCPVHVLGRGHWTEVPIGWRLAPLLQPYSVWRAIRRVDEQAPDMVHRDGPPDHLGSSPALWATSTRVLAPFPSCARGSGQLSAPLVASTQARKGLLVCGGAAMPALGGNNDSVHQVCCGLAAVLLRPTRRGLDERDPRAGGYGY